MTGLVGRVLAGRYRVDNVVSSGANTVIAEAVDIEVDRPVTVKIVRPELAATESFRTAFRRQADLAMAMTHPNIAVVFDHGEVSLGDTDSVFWVVEYLGGGSLRDLFDRGRLLEPSQALVVGLEACRALDAAHQRGIVHTEITPSKLVFGEDARLRIVDFGLAALLGAPAWREPATVPTHVARYASPEQALGLPVDAKTDIYALSLCLLEAVTGSVPFAGDSTVSTLAARVGKLMPVSADMGSLAAVLERAGRPEADDRFSAAEFGRALVQAAGKLPRPEPVPIMAASLFATSQAEMRRPTDPTGGIARPPDDPPPAPDDTAPEPVAVAPVAAEQDADDPVAEEAGAPASPPEEPAPDDETSAPAVVAGVAAAGVAAAAVAATDSVDAADPIPPADPVDPVPTDEPDLPDTEAIDIVPVVPEPTQTSDEREVADTEPVDAVEPLIILTDVADNPTGAVQAAGSEAAQATAAGAVTAVVPNTPPPIPPIVDPTPSGTLYDAERESRPWGKYVLIGFVALVGLALLGYAGWFLLRTESYEVPDLTGVDEAIARNEIAGNGWVVVTERERSDAVPEIDNVVRTTPIAGVMLAEGETFVLYVSDGPELRTLPELEGLTLAEAEAELVALRLVPEEGPPEFSETVPTGIVIRWQVKDDASLAAGAQVLPETVVVLTVSQGPEPRPAPVLTGLPVDQATAAVEGLQLVFARGDDVFSNDVPAGVVVSQEPAPGTPVERGGTVTVQVSKGPDLVAIPELDGLVYPEAEQALLDAGFVIDSLLGTTEGTFVSISVDGEEVATGDTFLRGTGVDLVFL